MRATFAAVSFAALALASTAAAVPSEANPSLTGPDIAVKVVAPAHAKKGRLVTTMVTVTNRGSQVATDIVATGQLWQHAQYVAITRSQGSSETLVLASGATVTWDLDELEPGASAVLFVVLRPVARGRMVDTVAVTAPGDPDARSNTGRTTTAVR
jgi:Domain of unknown function DUF11